MWPDRRAARSPDCQGLVGYPKRYPRPPHDVKDFVLRLPASRAFSVLLAAFAGNRAWQQHLIEAETPAAPDPLPEVAREMFERLPDPVLLLDEFNLSQSGSFSPGLVELPQNPPPVSHPAIKLYRADGPGAGMLVAAANAASPGQVALNASLLAGDYIMVVSEYLPALRGNCIIIDHGCNIFSVYMHLSKRLVNVGDSITKNQLIGKVGHTGFVTGPHLHWTIRVGWEACDPFRLAQRGLNF